jgi:thiamine pyrophosphate-dependent acetolactate synthase large subunit-like protein
MGAKGICIEEPGDVREGLAAALSHQGGPVMVDAVVDPYALPLPPHVPFHAASGLYAEPRKTSIERKNGLGDPHDRT